MERAEWLQQVRQMTEAIYDYVSPEYWVNYGFYENKTHLKHLNQFLAAFPKGVSILSAACGAGRYDGILFDAGLEVLGIDQSSGMLSRAQQRFPGVRYAQMALQQMSFHEQFAGILCMDAMEHISPEDWPDILVRFHDALQPGGLLYFSIEQRDEDEVQASYDRAQAMGLPVVYGELADGVQACYDRVKGLASEAVPGQPVTVEVYHYYPDRDQVCVWLRQSGLSLVEQGTGSGYFHFIARRSE